MKKCTRKLVMCEIKNAAGNPFALFFGIVFPTLMLFIITSTMTADVPKSMQPTINTQIFITMSLIIPMAVVFLGYSANYSQELEKEIPLRMRLFGFSEHAFMTAKIIAQALAVSIGFLFYTVVSYCALDLKIPRFSSGLCLIICLYITGALLFLLAHGLANVFQKFGPTYAICMLLYFGIMVLCGMMGIQTDQLPEFLQRIAALLPMNYISSDFIDFWTEGSYNFAPLIQSFLFLAAVGGILLLYANYRNRRVR